MRLTRSRQTQMEAVWRESREGPLHRDRSRERLADPVGPLGYLGKSVQHYW